MTEPEPAAQRRPRRWRLIAAAGLCGVVLLAWIGQAGFLMALPRQPISNTPADVGLDFRPVALHVDSDTRTPLTLNAWYVPGRRAETVVLLHGRGDSRVGLLPLIRVVHELGYTALAMEFRAHGDSDGTWSSAGAAEQRDLIAALDWVDTNAPTPVAALGYSMGGCVALMVAARDTRLRGVVTEGAPADVPALARHWYGPLTTPALILATPWIRLVTGASPWDARPEQVIARIAPRPLLLIHSRVDRVVPFAHGQRLYRAAGDPKQFWVMEDARHVGGIIHYRREYRMRLGRFFRRVFDQTDTAAPAPAA